MLILSEIQLDRADERRPMLDMKFDVRHNVGTLPTTLEHQMLVKVDPESSKVTASLVLDQLEAESLERARLKMAEWCDRMAAALRNVERQQAEVPVYERQTFNLDEQPAWIQRECAVLIERYRLCATDGAIETRADILRDLKEQGHPLVYIYGAIEQLEMHSYPKD